MVWTGLCRTGWTVQVVGVACKNKALGDWATDFVGQLQLVLARPVGDGLDGAGRGVAIQQAISAGQEVARATGQLGVFFSAVEAVQTRLCPVSEMTRGFTPHFLASLSEGKRDLAADMARFCVEHDGTLPSAPLTH